MTQICKKILPKILDWKKIVRQNFSKSTHILEVSPALFSSAASGVSYTTANSNEPSLAQKIRAAHGLQFWRNSSQVTSCVGCWWDFKKSLPFIFCFLWFETQLVCSIKILVACGEAKAMGAKHIQRVFRMRRRRWATNIEMDNKDFGKHFKFK